MNDRVKKTTSKEYLLSDSQLGITLLYETGKDGKSMFHMSNEDSSLRLSFNKKNISQLSDLIKEFVDAIE